MAYDAHRSDPYATDSRSRGEFYDEDVTKHEKFQRRRQVDEAVGAASDQSTAAQQIPPAVMAQIVREVTDKVLASGIGSPPPGAQGLTVPRSPSSTSASLHPRNVYTPPSPTRNEQESYGSSPERSPDDAHAFSSKDASTAQHHGRVSSPPPVYEDTVRARPDPVRRVATDAEETTLEKIWGRLFDSEGRPTARLGQFLRGLAIHIIEDYEPRYSLVITPDKMLRFYHQVRLPEERYPWSTMFGKMSNSSISKLYRELSCPHHLVQEQDEYQDTPRVPGLTPVGFEIWMTSMIRAHPDMEFERLAKAVLAMPISNADEPSERFPKELPRRLFPKKGEHYIQQRIMQAVAADPTIVLPKHSSSTSSTTVPPMPAPPHGSMSGNLERERNPYVGAPSESAVDDSVPPPFPLERERKPYISQPGGGKLYEDDDRSSSTSEPRRPREDSTTTRPWYSGPQQAPRPPEYIPPSRHQRTGSTVNNPPHRRTRSPSISNGYNRSGESVSDIPPAMYPPYSVHNDSKDDDREFARNAEARRNEWARRQADEEMGRGAGYAPAGIPPPPPQQHRGSFDEEYYRRGTGPAYGHVSGGAGAGFAGYPPPPMGR